SWGKRSAGSVGYAGMLDGICCGVVQKPLERGECREGAQDSPPPLQSIFRALQLAIEPCIPILQTLLRRTAASRHGPLAGRHPTPQGPHHRQHHRECAHDQLAVSRPAAEVRDGAAGVACARLCARDAAEHERVDGRDPVPHFRGPDLQRRAA
ncbi:hypothetical protein B0A49_14029, partial [Cryomyces minteri]